MSNISSVDLVQPSSLLLAIETSCDETAAAVLRGRTVISSTVSTQIAIHAQYGGVVPEIASRAHVENLPAVVEQTMQKAGLSYEDLDAIAVTAGPGLIGALLCGVSYAKALAFACKKPLVPVHHIEGHICANYVPFPELEPPFLCLVASGGHSHIIAVESYTSFRTIGRTRDDAAGEAFDKAARVLQLPYPGGPLLDELAEDGDEHALTLPIRPLPGFDFSFSGLKTALLQSVQRAQKAGAMPQPKDIAASFRRAVVDQLTHQLFAAQKELRYPAIALAGGVAANRLLRREVQRLGQKAGVPVYIPPMRLCTDNAEMIGAAAQYRFANHIIADRDLNATATWPLE